MRRRLGFTLLEVLIVCALLVLLGWVVLSLLIPSLRSWLTAQNQSEAQRNVMLVVARLREEVRLAHPQSITSPTANRVSFLSARGPLDDIEWNPKGQMLWQRWETLYLDGSNQVLLNDAILTPPDPEPSALTPPTSFSAPGDRVLARQITLFDCRGSDGLVQVAVEARCGGSAARLETAMCSGIEAP